MTDHKFTDMESAIIHAFDLINRQKAEIERLQDERDGRIKSLAAAFNIAEAEARVEAYILSQKAEAIKEFAERLKYIIGYDDLIPTDCVMLFPYINDIVKELTEGKQ